MPKIPDIMAFLLKIALVLYLTNASGRENGMEKYGNYIDKISTTLQAMVLNNRNGGMCDYSDKSYLFNVPIAGGGKVQRDFSYLKMWDLLDCRFFYYFTVGLRDAAVSDAESIKDITNRKTTFDVIMGVFDLATFRLILILIGCVLFGIFVFFTIIQVTELMILSILAFHVLILISPIFIPFILFKATKQTFDGWINQIVTYSLYPVMLFSFLSFMFIVVDHILFAGTKFVPRQAYVEGSVVRTFGVDNSVDHSANCAGFQTYKDHDDIEPGKIPVGCDCNGVGCMMSSIVIKTRQSTSVLGPSVGLSVNANEAATHKMEINTLALLFIMFVMYHLSKMLTQIAQALSGSTKALMNAGRNSRGAHSRMEGLAGMTAGMFNSKKRPGNKDDKKDDDSGGGKASRGVGTSASTQD
jgi:type IV secretion system protein VirB6